ncbi:MAG TPA: Asp23/Gls24 family envelope stress response protein [Anaerolineae bacterium]|nr:Asp23/Gls24 family envelope stress response protein [Anaerolineae bacterium]
MAESIGRVTVAQQVLDAIVQLTTLNVPGVARLGARHALRPSGDGVHVEVNDNHVVVDVYVIVAPEVNLRDVGRTIQTEVARAMQEMVGMEVDTVNVHIQDVEASAGS